MPIQAGYMEVCGGLGLGLRAQGLGFRGILVFRGG